MRRSLIIGGSGSWGQELTRQLLKREPSSEITIYSRGEHHQVDMARSFNNDPRLHFVIGDIRDKDNLKRATKGIHTIFHLAALKHVPVCERNPEEAVKTNILGTQNAVEVAIENEVEKFTLVSTDKAVDPINVYGASKCMAEKIVTNANLKVSDTLFVCIRGGNVLGTQGSVVPLFKEQILRNNEVTITDRSMTRYLMRLRDAVSLIFTAIDDTKGGEIFVMKMSSVRIIDLAEVIIHNTGNPQTKVRTIGTRPGEKLHELLVSRQESARTFEHGNYYVILPTMNIRDVYTKWNRTDFLQDEYGSKNNKFLSQDELEKIIQEENQLTQVPTSDFNTYSKEELLDFFRKEGWGR